MTFRKLRVLLTQLPAGSRTAAALGAPHDEWSRTEQLLAGLFDAVQALTWVTVCAHTEGPHRPEQPDPLPRPGIVLPEPAPFLEHMRRLATL